MSDNERRCWDITLFFFGDADDARRFFDWLIEGIPAEFKYVDRPPSGVSGTMMSPGKVLSDDE